MMVPDYLKYNEEHQWVKIEGNTAIVGITDHAQEALGEIVFVELPEVGAQLQRGESFGVVESVKSASDCYIPVAGIVMLVNEKLLDGPEVINQDPYGEGWMLKLSNIEDVLNELMDAQEYEQYLLQTAQDEDS